MLVGWRIAPLVVWPRIAERIQLSLATKVGLGWRKEKEIIFQTINKKTKILAGATHFARGDFIKNIYKGVTLSRGDFCFASYRATLYLSPRARRSGGVSAGGGGWATLLGELARG